MQFEFAVTRVCYVSTWEAHGVSPRLGPHQVKVLHAARHTNSILLTQFFCVMAARAA